MVSAALNVSNSNELQNPFKNSFKFIVFSCHHCHTWKGKRGTGIYKVLQKYLQDFQTKKTDLLSSH